MNRADVIFFNVERTETLHGFTTNVEFGKYITSARVVYYRPIESKKNNYLDKLAIMNEVKVHDNQDEALSEVLSRVNKDSLREKAECAVPGIIWNSGQFKQWYFNLKEAGNSLADFEIKSIVTFKANTILFGFNAWVKIWVASENRYKENEWIFSRAEVS